MAKHRNGLIKLCSILAIAGENGGHFLFWSCEHSDITKNGSIEFLIHQSMHIDTNIMLIACCSVKMNTFCNLPGSWQPSWLAKWKLNYYICYNSYSIQ